MKMALSILTAIVLVGAAPVSAAGPTVVSFENFHAGHLPGPFPSMCGIEANYRTLHEVGTERTLVDGNGGLHIRRDVTATLTFLNDSGGPGSLFTAWTTTATYREILNVKPGRVTTTTTVSKATTTIGPTGQVLTTKLVTHTTVGADGRVRSQVENEVGRGAC
jgi:hypothetical protein